MQAISHLRLFSWINSEEDFPCIVSLVTLETVIFVSRAWSPGKNTIVVSEVKYTSASCAFSESVAQWVLWGHDKHEVAVGVTQYTFSAVDDVDWVIMWNSCGKKGLYLSLFISLSHNLMLDFCFVFCFLTHFWMYFVDILLYKELLTFYYMRSISAESAQTLIGSIGLLRTNP